ncbi:MAG: ABC transporter ATP-binding protein [Geminicoccaceae bacterium]|nr:MAG: ABC transporter ATP-binding protein [Geminicoccaceae bacterium]
MARGLRWWRWRLGASRRIHDAGEGWRGGLQILRPPLPPRQPPGGGPGRGRGPALSAHGCRLSANAPRRMHATIFGYIRAHSWRQQLLILALTLVSLPFFYLWVELPKRIVDDALGGPAGPREFWGLELSRLDYLFALCLLFLGLVLINGAFKYVINVYKGVVGERMLRRLRYELYQRILRFPPGHFRVMSQGQLVQMINAEVEPLGGFIGDAYALPAYQGGMLLTILAFMFVQNPLLGFAAILFYPLQIWLIPKLQRQVNELGRRRVRQMRVVAERIGETTSGVIDIRANAAQNYEQSRFADELGKVFFIRFAIFKKKFLIKFINNFLAQFAPFLFYSVGGYLVLQGELTIGAILAIIAAHEKLAAPWKELLTYYQNLWDARIKYEQVVAQFDPPGLLREIDAAAPADVGAPTLLQAKGLTVVDDDDETVVNAVEFDLELPAHVAVTGRPGGGQHALLQVAANLRAPLAGSLHLGDLDVAKLAPSATADHVAYVGNSGQVFAGSLRDNLLLGLKHKPPAGGKGSRTRQDVLEAKASGNSPFDGTADWVDYTAAGVADAKAIDAWLAEVATVVRLDQDLFALGLRGELGAAGAEALGPSLLEARRLVAERREADPKLARLIEGFDPERYNSNATVAENLLFGTPLDAAYELERLPENRFVLEVLAATGLDVRLRQAGYALAETMVELFADLPPDHEYYRQFSFIGPDDLPDYRALIGRITAAEVAKLKDGRDRRRLLALPLRLIPTRHRLGVIDPPLQAEILQARRRLRAHLPASERSKIAFFDPEAVNRAASVQDNILFGRIAYGQANAGQVVAALVGEIIDRLDLRAAIVTLGLGAPAGIGGVRLTAAQRQKVALGRALARRPSVLVLDDPLAPLDRTEQDRLQESLRAHMAGRTMLWAHQHPEWLAAFDRVIVMDGAAVVSVGPPPGAQAGAHEAA